jgi:chaperonin GroEL
MTQKTKSKRVVFQPHAQQAMQRGINLIAEAVRPTLGPLPRIVAITKVKPHDQTPEMLDSAGVIARRIYQLPDRDTDTGAMFIRQALWRQHDELGDGTATLAVLLQAVFNQSLKFITAGGNPMLMRRHLEAGMRCILQELEQMTLPVTDRGMIAQVAESVCFDPLISERLGEIFDILGVYGQVDIRSGRGRETTREYVSGTNFEGGFHAQWMVNDREHVRAQLENPAIFLSDLELKSPDQVIPLVKATLEAGSHALVVIAREISEQAIGVLFAASRDPQRFRAMSVKVPGTGISEQAAFLLDLGMLTGGRPFLQAAGDSAQRVQAADLGQARRVWADKEFMGVISGKGAPRAIRLHLADLRRRYAQVGDKDERKRTLARLGKLQGGSATLYIGGISEIDINAKKELAEWAIGAVRGALLKGVLPGGGAALLACKPALDEMAQQAETLEERVAYQVLSRSLEEPARALLANAGYEPSVYIARIAEAGPGMGFDARKGEIVDMVQAGIFDSAGVLIEAVHGAISSAALALTVDVLAHRKRQKMANRP